jgi:hypothetical protein
MTDSSNLTAVYYNQSNMYRYKIETKQAYGA